MEVIMTIGLAPVTKKNSQQILKNDGTGRPFIAPSRAYREYAEAAAWCLRTYRLETIRQPVEVKALFYMPTRRKVDLTNLLEALDAIETGMCRVKESRDIWQNGLVYALCQGVRLLLTEEIKGERGRE